MSVQELIERELAPYTNEEPTRIVIDGESVWLQPAFAVALRLAIHELTTNAARHATLTTVQGQVSVRRTISTDGTRRQRVLV